MENELKPCPFCGGKAELSDAGYKCKDGKKRFVVRCSKCGTSRCVKPKPINQAAADWNERAENEELKFTREFIHEHGLEFALASAWRGRCADGT